MQNFTTDKRNPYSSIYISPRDLPGMESDRELNATYWETQDRIDKIAERLCAKLTTIPVPDAAGFEETTPRIRICYDFIEVIWAHGPDTEGERHHLYLRVSDARGAQCYAAALNFFLTAAEGSRRYPSREYVPVGSDRRYVRSDWRTLVDHTVKIIGSLTECADFETLAAWPQDTDSVAAAYAMYDEHDAAEGTAEAEESAA
ncbi:hypothetical protein [Corynebacterium sp. AOP12-C2-36]|uniref:hypothetical protein n=1 Tax=Corynebacterium sp. AOP12-C2-36 TaxID=3457723 RepID=UPI004033640F